MNERVRKEVNRNLYMLLPINLSFNKEDVLIPVVAIETVDKACRTGSSNVNSKRSMRSKCDESRVFLSKFFLCRKF